MVVGSSSAAKVESAKARLAGAEGFAIDVKDEASVAAFFEKIGAFDHLVFTGSMDWMPNEDAILFSINDRPSTEALGLYREEAEG